MRTLFGPLTMLLACVLSWPARGEALPEYRLKAAYLYNFATFTEWPAGTGPTLRLCVHGGDPFGEEIDRLQGKTVDGRTLTVQRTVSPEDLKGCQIVYISPAAADQLPGVLDRLSGKPVLTVADSEGAARQGVGINMVMVQQRVAFEVNLAAVRRSGLNLSSKLLRLASEVYR